MKKSLLVLFLLVGACATRDQKLFNVLKGKTVVYDGAIVGSFNSTGELLTIETLKTPFLPVGSYEFKEITDVWFNIIYESSDDTIYFFDVTESVAKVSLTEDQSTPIKVIFF